MQSFTPKKVSLKERDGIAHLKKIAPHLSERGRVWVEVEVDDYELYDRPESQGGTWVLAQKMKVVNEQQKEDK